MKKLMLLLIVLLVFGLSSCFLFTLQGIEVNNNSSYYNIWYVWIRESGSTDWGDDQLGSSEVIYSGDSRYFPLDAGTYDIWVRYSTENEGGLTYIEVEPYEVREVNVDDDYITLVSRDLTVRTIPLNAADVELPAAKQMK